MSLDGNIRIGPKIAVQIYVTNVKTEDQNVEKASFVKEVHQRQKCTLNLTNKSSAFITSHS